MGIEYDIPKIDNTVYPDNPKIATLLPEIYQDIENINASSGSSQDGKFTHIDKAKELLSLEFYSSAAKEIEAGSGEFEQDNLRILEISTLYLKAKDYLNSQKLIAKYFSKLKSNLNNPYKDYVYYMLYPYGFKEYIDKYSGEFNVDPLFVLAVIREESRFQPDAGSYAGALGLMQIIPKTGKGIASQLGISKFSNQMLLDPEVSIRMGSYYLSRQLESFNQNKYYACGAYNGGPGSMSKWISSWGDKDIDEFIEYVSYDETRNYIKKVMGSYFFYQMLYP
jgi:soluble lytic murein transglycosylase-like protein